MRAMLEWMAGAERGKEDSGSDAGSDALMELAGAASESQMPPPSQVSQLWFGF